jgi:hypothetical protein
MVRPRESHPDANGRLAAVIRRPTQRRGCALAPMYGTTSGWYEIDGEGSFFLTVESVSVESWEMTVFRPRGS